eukprot:TRINITY_DN3211_c0_g6_i1.p1 TRINITY_DN3211_c0_g6~~TRINITY_DN3211_c0_g6_i1.p1  ORF type:complete len:541 (-),score=167.27 TRINITY_DN3211_c0_g6_i1:3-1625(-)
MPTTFQASKKNVSGVCAVPRITVNVCHTQYAVVREVLKNVFGYNLSTLPNSDFDLYWADTGITQELVGKLKPYQKVNHFPNMSCLARKNNLGKNLMKMRKAFKRDYSFFPPTWVLPMQRNELQMEIAQDNHKTYIVKPEGLSQGKGIFLTKCLEDIDQNERCIVQRYIRKPYLVEDLKFDLRIYALVYGCDPLRIYLFKEGLARFATEKYVKPNKDNIENLYMHLTNYAINKHSKNFIFNSNAEDPNVGHKRSLASIWKYIDDHGGDSRSLRRKIKRCIVKTLCAVQPQLSRCLRSCQPSNLGNDVCFEILGFDVLLDHKMKPWLLEVNHSPSFSVDTPFDNKVKTELIADTVRLLHLLPERRLDYWKKEQARIQSRAYSRVAQEKITKEQRETLKQEAMASRDSYELKHCGGFTRIYPDKKLDWKYQSFIDYAEEELEQFYGFRKRNSSAQTKLQQRIKSRDIMKSASKNSTVPLSTMRPQTGKPRRSNGKGLEERVCSGVKTAVVLEDKKDASNRERMPSERKPRIKILLSKYKENAG